MMQAYDSFMVLGGFDDNCSHYVEKYAVSQDVPVAVVKEQISLKNAVIKGLKEQAHKLTLEMLKETAPMDIINKELVPALDVVGQGFEKGTIFLPQLLMSAEAAKAGFEAVNESACIFLPTLYLPSSIIIRPSCI
jgi:5-methyltetrahydrofolate--homocysteine methyltransferase